MRSRTFVRFVLVGLLATVSAGLKCAEGPLDIGLAPPSTSVAGTWQGDVVDFTLRVSLTQSGTDITGTGTMRDSSTVGSVTVTGTNNNGSVSFTVTEPNFSPWTFTGTLTVTGTTRSLVGVGNGSGLSNTAITLVRQ